MSKVAAEASLRSSGRLTRAAVHARLYSWIRRGQRDLVRAAETSSWRRNPLRSGAGNGTRQPVDGGLARTHQKDRAGRPVDSAEVRGRACSRVGAAIGRGETEKERRSDGGHTNFWIGGARVARAKKKPRL